MHARSMLPVSLLLTFGLVLTLPACAPCDEDEIEEDCYETGYDDACRAQTYDNDPEDAVEDAVEDYKSAGCSADDIEDTCSDAYEDGYDDGWYAYYYGGC